MPYYPEVIEYSDKYYDDYFEYRHVALTKAVMKEMVRLKGSCNLERLLDETEWRGLGVQQSLGWTHYVVHKREMHILLFRRPIAIDYLEENTVDGFQCRHVRLPMQVVDDMSRLPRIRDESGEYRMLQEEECRDLGLQQSQGWMHTAVLRPDTHSVPWRPQYPLELVFWRARDFDPAKWTPPSKLALIVTYMFEGEGEMLVSCANCAGIVMVSLAMSPTDTLATLQREIYFQLIMHPERLHLMFPDGAPVEDITGAASLSDVLCT